MCGKIFYMYVPPVGCNEPVLWKQSNYIKEFISNFSYPLHYNSEYVEYDDLSVSIFGNIRN